MPLQASNRWHYLGRATLEGELGNLHISAILKFARATKKWTTDLHEIAQSS